jgi:subtilisin family serine protease
MKRANLIRFVALSVLLALWPAKSPAKDYVLTVGNEQLRFVPQGKKGYVVKQPNRPTGISVLAGTLFLEEGRVQPIAGLDRHGIWTVENDGPASRNDAVMAALIQDGAAEYVAPLFSSSGETVAIIPEIVVHVKPDTNVAELQSLCESVGCRIRKRMEFTEQEYLLEVLGPDASVVFAAVEALNQSSKVEWAAPNTAFQPKLGGQGKTNDYTAGEQLRIASAGQDASSPGVFPNDPYFPQEWHLHNTGQSGGTPGADIRAPEAWKITTGDPNIIIAVIDTGVDTKHTDLIDNLVPGYDFYDNDAQPDPATGDMSNAHGTACAGLVAAKGNNGVGVTGVTWNCKIMPIRTISFRVDGTQVETTEADTATAFRWAARNGADVLTYSWGQGSPLPAVQSAIVDVTKVGGMGRHGKGCIVLACSDNDNGPVRYPAKYPEVIAVGATDHDDQRCRYSNYGPELDVVAPSAPGYTAQDWWSTHGRGWVWTTDISGPAGYNTLAPSIVDYTAFAGTSAATPIAAGVVALILSVEPNLTGEEVRHFLERSAKDLGDPGRDDYYGWGRVDPRAALEMVLRARGDFNFDRRVDLRDFFTLADHWLQSEPSVDIAPPPYGDGVVDYRDFAVLAARWLEENSR